LSIFPFLHALSFLCLNIGWGHLFVVTFSKFLDLLLTRLFTLINSLLFALGHLFFKNCLQRLLVIIKVPLNSRLILASENDNDLRHTTCLFEKVRHDILDLYNLPSFTLFVKAKVVFDRSAPVTINDETLFRVDNGANILQVLLAFLEFFGVVYDLFINLGRRFRILSLGYSLEATLKKAFALASFELLRLLCIKGRHELERFKLKLLA